MSKNKKKPKEIFDINTDEFDKNNPFAKYIKKDSGNKNLAVISALIIAAIFFVLGIFGMINYFSEFSINQPDETEGKSKNGTFKLAKAKFGEGIFKSHKNILVLGVDSNGSNADPFENTRSDTILIFSINPKDKSVNIISIPRDSKVYIAQDKGVNKINAAHALGGIKLTKQTIEETFGIRINNYVVFNTEGVVKLIDAIGGVPVYVEKDMRYTDWSGKLHINLTKGEHVLSGKDAECFLRFRMDTMGDIGRTSRQQWFLKALAERMKSPEVLSKIPEALKIAEQYIKTDLSLYQMSQYAALASDLDMTKIETATLPGSPNKRGYVSYWILDPDKCREVINRMIYNRKSDYSDQKATITILYTNENKELAEKIQREMTDEGYDVKINEKKKLPHSQIIGHTPIASGDFVGKLKSRFKELENYQFVYDPMNLYGTNTDITMIIVQ